MHFAEARPADAKAWFGIMPAGEAKVASMPAKRESKIEGVVGVPGGGRKEGR